MPCDPLASPPRCEHARAGDHLAAVVAAYLSTDRPDDRRAVEDALDRYQHAGGCR